MSAQHRLAPNMAAGIALAAIGVVGSASAAEPDRCAPEGATTVCRIEGKVLRVIEETQSPSGQYGVAWLVPVAENVLVKDPDGSIRADGVEVANVLVRLADPAIVAHHAGMHPGDRASYNHLRIDVHWSAGSTFVGVVNQDKWETLSGVVFRIAANGNDVAGPLDLLAFSRDAGLRYLARQKPPIDTEGFETRLMLDTLANDGKVRAKVTMEEPGGGGAAYAFSIDLEVEDDIGKLQAKVIRLGLLQRIDPDSD